MTSADQVHDCQGRCQRHLLRLRVLARGQAGPVLTRQVTAEVREITNAIIAEAETACLAALAAPAGTRPMEAETFQWVRLARLARAADQAIDAARGADVPGLRHHLGRFGALAAAAPADPRATRDPGRTIVPPPRSPAVAS